MEWTLFISWDAKDVPFCYKYITRMPVFVLYCCETTTTVETVYSSQFTEGLPRLASIIEKQRQQGGDMAAKAEGSHLRQQTGSRESRLQQCKSLNSQNSGLGLERWLSSSEYVLLLQRKFSSQHTHIRCLTTTCPSGTRKCNILFWPPQTTAVFTYSVKKHRQWHTSSYKATLTTSLNRTSN